MENTLLGLLCFLNFLNIYSNYQGNTGNFFVLYLSSLSTTYLALPPMTPRTEVVIRSVNKTPDNFFKTEEKPVAILQVNNSEIVIKFFHITNT